MTVLGHSARVDRRLLRREHTIYSETGGTYHGAVLLKTQSERVDYIPLLAAGCVKGIAMDVELPNGQEDRSDSEQAMKQWNDDLHTQSAVMVGQVNTCELNNVAVLLTILHRTTRNIELRCG